MSSTDELGEILAPYLSAGNIITRPISSLSVLFVIYGFYCAAFGLAVHTLSRQKTSKHRLYKWGSTALFILATVYTTTFTWGILRQAFIEFQAATTQDYSPFIRYLIRDSKKTVLEAFTDLTATFMNIVAESVLIHQCHVVYNSNRRLLYHLAFVALILNGIDFGCTIGVLSAEGNFNFALLDKLISIDNGVLIAIAVFQASLSLLIGGRICWITREATKLSIRKPTSTRFRGMTAIIIESAALYAGSLLIAVILENSIWGPNFTGVVPFVFRLIPTLMSGLAPTMVITRVACGNSVDSVQQILSTFQIAEPENSQQGSSREHEERLSPLPEQLDRSNTRSSGSSVFGIFMAIWDCGWNLISCYTSS